MSYHYLLPYSPSSPLHNPSTWSSLVIPLPTQSLNFKYPPPLPSPSFSPVVFSPSPMFTFLAEAVGWEAEIEVGWLETSQSRLPLLWKCVFIGAKLGAQSRLMCVGSQMQGR